MGKLSAIICGCYAVQLPRHISDRSCSPSMTDVRTESQSDFLILLDR